MGAVVRHRLKALLRRCGISVARYRPHLDPSAVRQTVVVDLGIDVVLDVGANAGQFASQIRRDGFAGRIASFEPLSSAFRALEACSSQDPLWDVRQCALGREPAVAKINIAGNSWSSSLLPMLDRHRDAAPESAYVGTEDVTVRTLDDVYGELVAPGAKAFMKVDTQGFTMSVLDGGERALGNLLAVQVELSLVPLYAGEPLIAEVLAHLYERHFKLVHIEPEFVDASGRQLQVNGLLVRS